MRALRFVLVGTGGKGRNWCMLEFPYLRSLGKAEVTAAVDIVPEHLANAREFRGLPGVPPFRRTRSIRSCSP